MVAAPEPCDRPGEPSGSEDARFPHSVGDGVHEIMVVGMFPLVAASQCRRYRYHAGQQHQYPGCRPESERYYDDDENANERQGFSQIL